MRQLWNGYIDFSNAVFEVDQQFGSKESFTMDTVESFLL